MNQLAAKGTSKTLQLLKMAANIEELRKSEFWKKKFRKAVVTRDTNKNGSISRGDFEIVFERYKKTAKSSPEKLNSLSKAMFSFCDKLGLVAGSGELSYEEFESRWQSIMAKQENCKGMFKPMFKCLDANDDGYISLTEWQFHNSALGISQEYSKNSFDAMDRDGDGKVKEDEFVDYHDEYYHTAENKLNSAILYGPL